jgi:hypothetical protein
MSARVLSWRGSEGAVISVVFDEDVFGSEEMQRQIALMSGAHPNLPDEAPKGSSFAFARDGTGYLLARFRVGDTVYRSADRGSLPRLWESVHYIASVLHPLRHDEKVAS